MILPLLHGLFRFSQAPVTWILFLLNAFVFLGGFFPSLQAQSVMDQYLDNEQFNSVQGRLFAQYILEQPSKYTPLLRKLASQEEIGVRDKTRLLSGLALRDASFMQEAVHTPFRGDQVEIQHWRQQILLMKNSQEHHPSYILGLTSSDELNFIQWLSYMFVHSGLYHFLGNMYFLLIFGSILEPMMGGLALLSVFLASGMVAAGVFILLTGATAVPLIGASGAISGWMALFALFYGNRPVRYFYFILPSVRYVGLIFLPAWVVFIMFVLADLSGYWSSIHDLGGVAYAAHLGGDLAGLTIGLVVYLLRFKKGKIFCWPQHVHGQPWLSTQKASQDNFVRPWKPISFMEMMRH